MSKTVDLAACRGSATSVKLMEEIGGKAGSFHVLCHSAGQEDLVDRIAARARDRGLTSATVITEIKR